MYLYHQCASILQKQRTGDAVPGTLVIQIHSKWRRIMKKKAYEKPVLARHGLLRRLTKFTF